MKTKENLTKSSGSMPKGNESRVSRKCDTSGSSKHDTKNKPGWNGRKYTASNKPE